MNKYQHLFSPVKIGTVEVPNRIALLPMGVFSPRMMNNDGSYTKDGADYYIIKSKRRNRFNYYWISSCTKRSRTSKYCQ